MLVNCVAYKSELAFNDFLSLTQSSLAFISPSKFDYQGRSTFNEYTSPIAAN
jgi:hypothetical protein